VNRVQKAPEHLEEGRGGGVEDVSGIRPLREEEFHMRGGTELNNGGGGEGRGWGGGGGGGGGSPNRP